MTTGQLRGKRVYAFESTKDILAFIEDKKKILIALNAEKIINPHEQLTRIINNNISYPDGIGAVIALRLKGIRARKIAGADLWLKIVSAFQHSKSFYLIGSTDEVIDNTVRRLRSSFSGINIKNYRNGYLSPEDIVTLKSDLIEKKPDIVFVAMGSPRQEFLMEDLLMHHEALYMGLGGSFDVYTEKKARAPRLFIAFGLEWFYRLVSEPTRIKRQVVLFKYLVLLLLRRL